MEASPSTSTPALILQPRDRDVLTSLGENGIMDTDMIHDHYFQGVTNRRCRQRLCLYQEHGLTRTITLRLWTSDRSQRIPTIHSLSERGAEVVESFNGNAPLRVSKGEPQPATIHHRLQIVRTKLTFDSAFRANRFVMPKWVFEQDRDPGASSALPPNQRRLLYHTFAGAPGRSCQPDMACHFQVPRDIANLTAGTNDVVGYFEIDCSSEGRKQVANKLPGYVRLLNEKAYRRYFQAADNAIVRVFWICRSLERIQSLCERFTSEPVSQYFRFTTIHELMAESAVTAPIWQDITGKRREIIRLPAGR